MSVLFTFLSVHNALKAEKLLRKENLLIDIIPTPRTISASCGISVIVAEDKAELAERQMRAAGVQIDGKYAGP